MFTTQARRVDQSCAQCHKESPSTPRARWPAKQGARALGEEAEAQEVNATCLTCHEKTNQSSWEMSKHARRNLGAVVHSVHSAKSLKASSRPRPTPRPATTCTVGAGEGDEDVASPGARRQDDLLELPQPARGKQASMLKEDTSTELCYQCHTEKRGAVPLRARAGSRGLRVLPRAARHEPHAADQAEAANLCWNCTSLARGHFGRATTTRPEGHPGAPPRRASGYPT